MIGVLYLFLATAYIPNSRGSSSQEFPNTTIRWIPTVGRGMLSRVERDPAVGGEFGWVGFLVVYFKYNINPDSRKTFVVGKRGPNDTLSLIFLGSVGLGLGSSSVS